MRWKTLIKREVKIWHAHFVPSLIAGLGVAVVSLFFNFTIPNVLLFSSIGPSAVILAHSRSHHLTKLRTAIVAYVIAIAISFILYGVNIAFPLHWGINLFLVVFLVGISLYLSDSFHPPAISAALAFVLFEGRFIDLIYLFISIFALLVIIRFLSYVLSSHLSVKHFYKEFKRQFLQ